MKLRSLRLHGFKSFADRTTVEFRDGITAIVGSNGCGKSNVADSIRWVLGEQRASAVRGAKMEEVIFQGTAKRRPLNFAEVALVFDNEAGRVPVPQKEIEVARKVFRESGSEYALNRATCRLRDIHALLRDTGLGANAYSIIEAGMIETLLSDRAEERRILFEEAAGVGRYKDSRQAATRRLDGAEADLTRLNDLVAEVEAKVRSLGRQRQKAQRHAELQARRLNLEVALGLRETESLRKAVADGERRWAALGQEQSVAAARRSTAEAILEQRRAESVELSHRRSKISEKLGELRQRLETREREVLLANERRSHAELCIEQIVRERAELERRGQTLSTEAARLEEERSQQAESLAELHSRREERAEEQTALRATVSSHRTRSEAAAARHRQLVSDLAALQGERTAAERRHREAEGRIAQLAARAAALASEAEELDRQTELRAEQRSEVRARLDAAEAEAEAAGKEVRACREREIASRTALREADDRLSRLAALVAAREALEASYEGFTPAVAALMAIRSRFPGVHGPLADFVQAPDSGAPATAVEAYLAPLLQAVVVEDLSVARTVRRWFREEWKDGGSLLLLPGDAPGLPTHPLHPEGPGEPGAFGPGQAWAAMLLGDLTAESGDVLARHRAGIARVGPEGDVVDARGRVRLAEREVGQGILTRREALKDLRMERDKAESMRGARQEERAAASAALLDAEDRARNIEELRRATRAELQRLEGEMAASTNRTSRLERERSEALQAVHSNRRELEESGSQLRSIQARLEAIADDADSAAAEAETARAALGELEGRWDVVREEDAELRVATARTESELRNLERRIDTARGGADAASARIAATETEAAELRSSLEGLSAVRERAAEAIQALFTERDLTAAEMAKLDARLAGCEAEMAEAERAARATRQREAEHAEERHRMELHNAESRGRLERVCERLEAEWGRPWDALVAAATPVEEGEPEEWAAEVRETARRLEALGPVNMLAVEEHREEEQRLSFLHEQQRDLVQARDDLAAAIRQINRTAREIFLSTFDTIRENFHRTFHSLFQGGECDIWLADPDDPLESPVEIQASPRGKRTQRIHLLSGGERTLTALALLFALYLVKPSPFCVLDEVDAPLDESNVGRFLQLLHDFKRDTQFIVITHNPRTMEAADWIYGVTMEEPGVSTMVGVELQGSWQAEDRIA